MVLRFRFSSAAPATCLVLAALTTACHDGAPAPAPQAPVEAAAEAAAPPPAPPATPVPAAASVDAPKGPPVAKRYEVPGLPPVEVGLYPAKSAFVLGEPVYLALRVKNVGARDVYTDHMGGSSDVFGRRERFAVTVFTEGGAEVRAPQEGLGMRGGNAADGPEKIAPGGTWETRLLLADSVPLTAPGRYQVRCQYSLGLGATMDSAWPGKAAVVPVDAAADVTLLPPDAAALGQVIEAYAREAASRGADVGDTPSLRAVRALGLIDDPRVVPPLARSATQGTYAEKFAALQALGTRGSGALDAIAAALHDPDANIVDSAAVALMISKDPHAVDTLWSARGNASAAVRGRLVSALERTTDATSTARLREMTRDPSPDVAKDARRVLAERAKSP